MISLSWAWPFADCFRWPQNESREMLRGEKQGSGGSHILTTLIINTLLDANADRKLNVEINITRSMPWCWSNSIYQDLPFLEKFTDPEKDWHVNQICLLLLSYLGRLLWKQLLCTLLYFTLDTLHYTIQCARVLQNVMNILSSLVRNLLWWYHYLKPAMNPCTNQTTGLRIDIQTFESRYESSSRPVNRALKWDVN